jgi:hypothetical protein
LVAADAIAYFQLSAPEFARVRATLLACSLTMTLGLATYAIAPFLAMRLSWRYLRTIALFPFYLCWKLWILLRGRPGQWVRTAREPNR